MTATTTVRRGARRKTHSRKSRKGRQARRLRRRRKALAVSVVVLVLAFLAASLWSVYFSTALVTERVDVVGARNLTQSQVAFAAQVPLGVPLARQDLDAIAERTTALSAIESVTVTRDWPRTIRLAVVERRPVLAVSQSSGYVIVDKFGVAYQTQPTLPPGVLLAAVNPGDAPLLSEVAIVAAALPKKLQGKVDQIMAGNRDSIALLLKSGRMVTWGSSSDSALKAQVVTALLKRKPKSSIDVSSPHNPAVR
jgi:cell division protein FtsQ